MLYVFKSTLSLMLEKKGMTEDEMVGWHHQINGHEFEQTRGDGEGQGSLVFAVHGITKTQIRQSN